MGSRIRISTIPSTSPRGPCKSTIPRFARPFRLELPAQQSRVCISLSGELDTGVCCAISKSRFQFRSFLHGRKKSRVVGPPRRPGGVENGRPGITGIAWTGLETRAKIPNPDVSALCIDPPSLPFLSPPPPPPPFTFLCL